MKELILKFVFSIRARVNRTLVPAYPLSRKFGFDRGKPVDRFYIERFLSENSKVIKGRVLEVTENTYTKKYGENRVKISDVLDIDPTNKKANIISDLRSLVEVKSGTYDTIILTHVLGMIDDLSAAVSELHRVLKPGGYILVTCACLAPNFANNKAFWRITKEGADYLFSKYFGKKNVKVESVGNYYGGMAFWSGMALEDLDLKILSKDDPDFPIVTTLIARK